MRHSSMQIKCWNFQSKSNNVFSTNFITVIEYLSVYNASLICISKACEDKLFLRPRWRIEVPYTHDCTRWKYYSYFFPQNCPAPSSQLSVSYMSEKFILGSIIRFSILLLVLIPSCLQYPSIYTDWMKPRVLSNTCGLLLAFTASNSLNKLIFDLHNFLATQACFHSSHDLAIVTRTPKLRNEN